MAPLCALMTPLWRPYGALMVPLLRPYCALMAPLWRPYGAIGALMVQYGYHQILLNQGGPGLINARF